ncbi:MAG: ribokinase [Rhodospirillales bacterium]|nr:ribokinase [Rhodospirillales bacterium]
MNRIVIVGSVNIDITSYLDKGPLAGETVFARDIAIALGGKGANQSVAASRLGTGTALIGCIGDDPFGHNALAALNRAGVDCHLTVLPDTATGLALIDVMADGSNSIRIGAGANGLVTAQQLEQFRDLIAEAEVLLLQNEIPLATSVAAAKIARAAGTRVLMDPAPAPARPWSKAVLQSFDLITPNGHEVEIITGHRPLSLAEARAAASAICRAGVPGAVVTMGELGVAWCVAGKTGERQASAVTAIDTVAAGDCFNAGLGVALAEGMDVDQAIDFACDVAALATTQKGASDSAPYAQDVDAYRNSVRT